MEFLFFGLMGVCGLFVFLLYEEFLLTRKGMSEKICAAHHDGGCFECLEGRKIMEGLKIKYFVLNPEKRGPYGRASRKAMLAYADNIEKANPSLAYDLRVWVERLASKGMSACPNCLEYNENHDEDCIYPQYEKLESELNALRESHKAVTESCVNWQFEAEKLTAERDKLREALEKIVKFNDHQWTDEPYDRTHLTSCSPCVANAALQEEKRK